jgi:hypothetical protein
MRRRDYLTFGGRRETLPTPFLDRLYALPVITRSLEDFHRLHHRDLADLSNRELWVDAERVRLRIALEGPPTCHWLWQRLDAIRVERQKRRRR